MLFRSIHGNNGDTIVIGATFAGQVFGSGNSPYYYHGAFNGFNLNGVASIPVSSSTSYAWNTSWQPGGPDIYNYNPYDVPSFPLNLSMPDISVPIFSSGVMSINTKAALYNNNRYQGNVQLLLTVKSITHNGSPYYGPLPPPYSVCFAQNQ